MSALSESHRLLPGPTLAEMVAEKILGKILADHMSPGERLPSARELGEEFGVSRTVIREAVSSLVARGVIETRSGVGLRVGSVSTSLVSDALTLFLRINNGGLEYQQVHEVRHLLELEVVRLACERATDADLEEIRQTHERMLAGLAEPERVAELDVDFHRQIAVATHNPLYVVVLDSLHGVLVEARRGAVLSPNRGRHAAGFHQRVLDAVLRRDADAAVAAMGSHLDDVAAHWATMQEARTDGSTELSRASTD